MKELSIEQKAKAYDEALKYAKIYYTSGDEDMKMMMKTCFPVLVEESEDERIRKELLQIAKESEDSFYMVMTPNKRKTLIAWLEKQGEKGTNGNQREIPNSEQKLADKVKPKFKVEKDKWYVCTSQYGNCIEGRNYKASLDGRIVDDYGTEYDMHDDAYRWFRHWTIQDAKDGDVLHCWIDGYEFVLIYKGIKDGYITTYGHLYQNLKSFSEEPTTMFCRTIQGHFIPATKEQCDLLFSKMKEAGYEWDAEKKELKKIVQKPAWSEEDDLMLKSFVNLVEMYYGGCIDKTEKNKMLDWLKSLKDKYTWKPSDEQINALAENIECVSVGCTQPILKGLLEDLKKLREE